MADRVRAAQAEAERRFRREGRQLAPLRVCAAALVVLVALTSTPAIGLAGRHLVLSICLVVFLVETLGWPIVRPLQRAGRVVELAVMAASGLGLAFVQPSGLSEIPGSIVVFIAGVALPVVGAVAFGTAVTAGVAIAVALGPAGGGDEASVVAGSALLCAVLGVTGALLRRYRLSQDRSELLLAQLEDARDDQARAAAAEERASIARELHDVLAHSLSGLSIQLEVARKLAAGTGAPDELRSVIERARDLAREGFVEAREAVGALRHDDQLGLDRLPELVEHFRRDLELAVTYHVEGASRVVAPDVGFALYRLAGEALTNAARHAAGAAVRVELRFGGSDVRLEVVDDGAGRPTPLSAEGSGWGLTGMRERIKRLGGGMTAGPAGAGWSVVASVPA